MLAIWRALDNFRSESSAQTYIYRVAHNTALRHVRKNSRELSFEQEQSNSKCDSFNPEIAMEKQQQINLLADAIRRLPVNQRQLISLSLEGLSYPKIAEITGLSTTNVGAMLSRAKQRLKQLMEQ